MRDTAILFESDFLKYENHGIKLREYDNPKKLIGFGDFCYASLNPTDPKVIAATEDHIRAHIPVDLPKRMTIEEFHYVSSYKVLPSKQETFQLIAKVLVGKKFMFWKPTLEANSHWSNWGNPGTRPQH